MNWKEAIEIMKLGHTVRRQSEMWFKCIDLGNPELMGEHWRDCAEHAATWESGEEGCRIMHAWSIDEKPVLVFMGAGSKVLFVPEDEHRNAMDWVIEESFGHKATDGAAK